MLEISEYVDRLGPYLIWMGWLSAGLFLFSLALVPTLLARIPADYFTRPRRQRTPPTKIAGIHYALLWVVRNLFALLLIMAGILMLVLPGQGLLTILLGLFAADFPGKKRLEQKLVSHPSIHASINWIRAKKGAEKLTLP
jgi:hypothetical protein